MENANLPPKLQQALQVVALVANSQSVAAACRAVGLSRSTYYNCLEKYPEIILQHQDAIRLEKKRELGLILLSKRALLEQALQQAQGDSVNLRERIDLLKYLDSRAKELEQMGLVEDDDNDLAAQILRTLPPREYGKNVLEPPSHYDWPDQEQPDEDAD